MGQNIGRRYIQIKHHSGGVTRSVTIFYSAPAELETYYFFTGSTNISPRRGEHLEPERPGLFVPIKMNTYSSSKPV